MVTGSTTITSLPTGSPTTFLAPLVKLHTYDGARVWNGLKALQGVYFPKRVSLVTRPPPTPLPVTFPETPVKTGGTTKLPHAAVHKLKLTSGTSTPVVDSGYASAEEDDDEDDYESHSPTFHAPHSPGEHRSNGLPCCSLFCSSQSQQLESECKTLEALRADGFERAFALRWLTRFVSRGEEWVEGGYEEKDEQGAELEVEFRKEILDDALDLLSAFTNSEDDDHTTGGDQDDAQEGDEDGQAYTRILTFKAIGGCSVGDEAGAGAQGMGGAISLTVEIRDAPINDNDHTSVGLQSWGSSIIFAEWICASPFTYLGGPSRIPSLPPASILNPTAASASKPLRILELGAGTGILSIVAGKLLDSPIFNSQQTLDVAKPDAKGLPTPATTAPVEIVATDYHPAVLANLAQNIATNFPPPIQPTDKGVPRQTSVPDRIDVHALDWSNPNYTSAQFDTRFDIILAADVVYEPEHARWIKACVENLLCLPNGEGAGGVFWMFIAVRPSGRHEGLDKTVDELFRGNNPDSASKHIGGEGESGGSREREPAPDASPSAFSENQRHPSTHGLDHKDATIWRLSILQTETVGRKCSSVGRADEDAYRLFKIGWIAR